MKRYSVYFRTEDGLYCCALNLPKLNGKRRRIVKTSKRRDVAVAKIKLAISKGRD